MSMFTKLIFKIYMKWQSMVNALVKNVDPEAERHNNCVRILTGVQNGAETPEPLRSTWHYIKLGQLHMVSSR